MCWSERERMRAQQHGLMNKSAREGLELQARISGKRTKPDIEQNGISQYSHG